MNIFKRLFKRPKPFIQEDWSNAKEVMNQRMKKEGEYLGMTIYSTPLGLVKGFPKISKAELKVLSICVDFVSNYGTVSYTDIANCSPSQTQRQIQGLITKGYLQRVKRGTYKLTFYK